MSTISNIATSISEMPEEVLFNFIRELRNNRRNSIIKFTPTKKSSTPSKPTTILDAKSTILGMSESDREKLLLLLEEKLNA